MPVDCVYPRAANWSSTAFMMTGSYWRWTGSDFDSAVPTP